MNDRDGYIDYDDYIAQRKINDVDTYNEAKQEASLSFDIAELTYKLRKKAGLTQTQLAKLMKTSQPAIARMESGGHTPNLEMLERLGRVFNTRLHIVTEDQLNNAA